MSASSRFIMTSSEHTTLRIRKAFVSVKNTIGAQQFDVLFCGFCPGKYARLWQIMIYVCM